MGRLDNVQTWISKVKWNVNRRNKKFGATALNIAVYVGPRKLDLVRYLIEKKNASVSCLSKSGTSAFILACENEDADPKLIRYLLDQSDVNVNRQIQSQSIKWAILRRAARLAFSFKISRAQLLRRVAESGGLTALHYAARRGDMEIVELLLEHGAKPSIKNDLGRDVLS
jgi:ankyrin repeat protein